MQRRNLAKTENCELGFPPFVSVYIFQVMFKTSGPGLTRLDVYCDDKDGLSYYKDWVVIDEPANGKVVCTCTLPQYRNTTYGAGLSFSAAGEYVIE